MEVEDLGIHRVRGRVRWELRKHKVAEVLIQQIFLKPALGQGIQS